MDKATSEPGRKARIRPEFPKRAVVTAGMPYGNKDLHFGHVGGVFIPADVMARFLRDRIGPQNVIFVSGTDCYGSPIEEHWGRESAAGRLQGTIEQFVQRNHDLQEKTLQDYLIGIDLFGTSSFGRASEIHRQLCGRFFETLYDNGHLLKITLPQFYDAKAGAFLNGRQVVGRCPIVGCQSERGYADECSLGHQYMSKDLLEPKSTLTGDKPQMQDVTNWYLDLSSFRAEMAAWVQGLEQQPAYRPFAVSAMKEFFEPPVIHVMRKYQEELDAVVDQLPSHELREGKTKALQLVFESLESRDRACDVLAQHAIRFRTGKTLVPFRLTGNSEWGLPAPALEGLDGLTFWVWPESLWAPISFTSACLEQRGLDEDAWQQWWCSDETTIYQFIGEDNIFFYGVAEIAMWLGNRGKTGPDGIREGDLQLPRLVANNHLLFLDKKASSSGKIAPPSAQELLSHYTPEQLRAHFLGLGLAMRSVGFRPKPLNPSAKENEGDPALKEGNLLTNVLNRSVRSCFYTIQKYFDGKLPVGDVSEDVLDLVYDSVVDFEEAMHDCRFHSAMAVADSYIRQINKRWARESRAGTQSEDGSLMRQALVDLTHMVKVATVLMHPVAPRGTEMVREYFNVGEELWSWEKIFDPIYGFMSDPHTHELKVLEPRVDFFPRHPSQNAF